MRASRTRWCSVLAAGADASESTKPHPWQLCSNVPLGETLPIPDIPKGTCVPWLLNQRWHVLKHPRAVCFGARSLAWHRLAALPMPRSQARCLRGIEKDGEGECGVPSAGCSEKAAQLRRGRWRLLPCVAVTGGISDLWEFLSFLVRSLFLLLSPFWAALFCPNN